MFSNTMLIDRISIKKDPNKNLLIGTTKNDIILTTGENLHRKPHKLHKVYQDKKTSFSLFPIHTTQLQAIPLSCKFCVLFSLFCIVW